MENYSKVYKLQEDRKETVKTLLHLQKVYGTSTKNLVQGMIHNNTHYMRDELSAEEAADAAKILTKMNECDAAAEW